MLLGAIRNVTRTVLSECCLPHGYSGFPMRMLPVNARKFSVAVAAIGASLLVSPAVSAQQCRVVRAILNPDFMRCDYYGEAPGMSMDKLWLCC